MEETFPDLNISFSDRRELPRAPRAKRQRDAKCSVSGCDKPCYCRRLCRSHYNRMWRYGQTAPIRKVKKKQEHGNGSPERLALLMERHKVFLARREQERRQHEYLAQGCDDFECPWGDDG
jgi:hypothetical protein